jgi:hypothetical protein
MNSHPGEIKAQIVEENGAGSDEENLSDARRFR